MPRLTATRRLDIMARAVAMGEDAAATGAESISIGEIATALNEAAETVRESLESLVWIEMSLPGNDIVDLVEAVRLEGDRLIVEQAWWRRLATLTPPEAARLYTRASVAASWDPDNAHQLGNALAKLRGIVGEITVVEGDAPHVVQQLRAARDAGDQVLLNIEGHDHTLVTSQARFSVVAVYRFGPEWQVTLRSAARNPDLDVEEGEPITIPADRVLAVNPVGDIAGSSELSPSDIDPDQVINVTLEYPISRDWILDPYDSIDTSAVGTSRRRSTIEAWGTGELTTILLRLGPETVVVEPSYLVDARAEGAREILVLYEP